jgi:hypothetical protein
MIRAFVRPFALAICFTTLLAGVPASADTYTIYNLTTDSYLPVGIDDFGNVLIDTTSNCSVPSGSGIASSFSVRGNCYQSQIRFQLRLSPTTEHHVPFLRLQGSQRLNLCVTTAIK